jgi:hypothetical protein
MKISVHAARALEYALKSLADDAMSRGEHEIDLASIENSTVLKNFGDELVQARAQQSSKA